MGLKCYFQVTKFVDFDATMQEKDVSYGYRIFDGERRDYFNLFIRDYLPTTPKDALEIIRDSYDDFYQEIITQQGFFFNEDWVKVTVDGQVQPKAA